MQPNHPHPDTHAPSQDATEHIGHLLRKAGQRHTAIFQQHVGDKQLTAIQFVTLCALRDRGASSQTELVDATAVDQATIRGILQRLAARRLIQQAPDQNDRRKVIVELTAQGRDLLERITPRSRKISDLTLEALNPAERVAIVYLLHKMIDSERAAA
ncbi:MarR family winged helix-turn-helix transcriptional regulator [Alcaligenes sp. SDU_A2]|uniref:MarR family winged helix-turn-helix transcriptional regulator n=1 Tax=Alcaligenes sp. SDU_A2 TaxID=3136634 RepID=UPI00311EEF7E